MRRVGVVDYGAGNLFSVGRGLRNAGGAFDWVTEPDQLRAFDALLLPGVGAFASGVAQLRAKNFDVALREFVATGKPLLGVCVGMQFLLSRSFEFGETDGLSLIEGDVRKIEPQSGWPSPNTGWRSLRRRADLTGTPFEPIRDGDEFYFAHSFYCAPVSASDTALDFDYGGRRICAAVRRDNVFGCQFHPEISGAAGLAVYSAFLNAD